MKRKRNSRYSNLSDKYKREFSETDRRHYGVFRHKHGRIKIEPKTMLCYARDKLTEEKLKIINNRKTHFFHPAKAHRNDYNYNLFMDVVESIINEWEKTFKISIEEQLAKIEKPKKLFPGDYGNFQNGISGYGAACAFATIKNDHNQREYENKVYQVWASLYSQFLLQTTSKIEAITVKVLDRSNTLGKKGEFNRTVLYATAKGKDKKVEDLPSFEHYDKLYLIWHFLKHNNLSTYKNLKDSYPTVLRTDVEYNPGDLAIYYICFSEDLISKLLNGCKSFFKEYCELAFDENCEQAHWNFDDYFIDIADNLIDEWRNPLGLQWYDDID